MVLSHTFGPRAAATASRQCLQSLNSLPSRQAPTASRQIFRHTQRRTLIPAPTATSGPLLERRSDRALPDVSADRSWLKSLPIFALIMAATAGAFFNYQKQSSSVVASTLYALRTSETAREVLGDEVQFASRSPWIRGELNQLRGRIDIAFWVKGSKAQGKVRFKSVRPSRMGFFETQDWSLEMEDGTVVPLLNAETGDPFQAMVQ